MEIFRIQNLNFTYPMQDVKAIDNLSLTINRGDFVTLCGASGCGKSTLLRLLKSALSPHGNRSGEILFEGRPLAEVDLRTQCQRIGFVQQSPENQIVTDKVWHELAFGMESLGYDTQTIRRRTSEMASFFGMEDWFYRDVSTLSGGQKQLLNLASVMPLQPSILILDEPTAQLDPIAAADFLSVLGKINRDLGTTILLAEHRLEEALPLSSKVIVLDNGGLLCSGSVQEVGESLKALGHPMFLAMPTAMRMWASLGSDKKAPVTVRDGRAFLGNFALNHSLKSVPIEEKNHVSKEVALQVKDAFFRYDRGASDVVKGLNFSLYQGEFFALLGGNGTGKSTTLKLLSSLLIPQHGKISYKGKIALLPQNPQTLFLKKTVLEDLEEVLEKGAEILGEIVDLCQLKPLLHRHPYDLSGGEQQRLALAKILLTRPDILLLDEPTKGLDAFFKRTLAQILKQLCTQDVSVLMVSHDVEFCAEYADRCGLFFDGNVVAQGTPREFFSGNSFYTTTANRIARELLPAAITADDIILACGGTPMRFQTPNVTIRKPNSMEMPHSSGQSNSGKPKPSMRAKLELVCVLLLIPLTLFWGQNIFGGRKYYATSLLILLECMTPFFLGFESRRPSARELVLIASLCALGIAGRAAFFMLPQCKPVMALVILSGVAFGGETGFLVGSVTMLASNILFSQGPWTPWQMFAMGIVGFFAGLLYRRKMLPRSRLSLCIYGVFSAIIIYGGIMNPASAFMWAKEVNLKMLLTYYASGFPMDCVQAAATAIFLWFSAEPILEKLERIKEKYGFRE